MISPRFTPSLEVTLDRHVEVWHLMQLTPGLEVPFDLHVEVGDLMEGGDQGRPSPVHLLPGLVLQLPQQRRYWRTARDADKWLRQTQRRFLNETLEEGSGRCIFFCWLGNSEA